MSTRARCLSLNCCASKLRAEPVLMMPLTLDEDNERRSSSDVVTARANLPIACFGGCKQILRTIPHCPLATEVLHGGDRAPIVSPLVSVATIANALFCASRGSIWTGTELNHSSAIEQRKPLADEKRSVTAVVGPGPGGQSSPRVTGGDASRERRAATAGGASLCSTCNEAKRYQAERRILNLSLAPGAPAAAAPGALPSAGGHAQIVPCDARSVRQPHPTAAALRR